MEPDARYYWRRACEELTAARRAVTPQARERHRIFVSLYLERLQAMNAPRPFGASEVEAEFAELTTPSVIVEAA